MPSTTICNVKRCRIFFYVVFVMLVATIPLQSQARSAESDHPSFEVATVKPSDPSDPGQGFHVEGRQIHVENESVISLIMFSFTVHPSQIVGGPEWARERFDIHGVADFPGEPNLTQLREMLRKLLEDRFGLKVHRETRKMDVYTITVDKGGAKLQPSKAPPNGLPDQTGFGGAQGQTMRFTNNSMAEFAAGMLYFLDRPVVDRTGLTGKYDFTLKWNPGLPSATPDDNAFPGIFTAVRDQLGLRLNAVKDNAEVLVIDELHRPTAN